MELIPQEIKESIPKLYDTEEQDNPLIYVKLFLDSRWTWYITELSIDSNICFGLVVSPFCEKGELGYFSLIEILELKSSLGLKVERDLSFTPIPLSTIKKI